MKPFTFKSPTPDRAELLSTYTIHYKTSLLTDRGVTRVYLQHPEFRGVMLTIRMGYEKETKRYYVTHSVSINKPDLNGCVQETHCPQVDYFKTTYLSESSRQSDKSRETARTQALSLIHCVIVLDDINQHYSKVDPAHFANTIGDYLTN